MITKSMIENMLQQLDETEDGIFLRQIYTIIKAHIRRRENNGKYL